MLSANNSPTKSRVKEQIARLSALTLIFSYAELLIPRIIPFFRVGLGNSSLLMAFDLTVPSFIVLSIVKSVASCLMAGTLLSPFFVISLAQSVSSALGMWLLYKINMKTRIRLLGLYGISMCGSAISAVVQISLSSLYLGEGTLKLLGPMLLFNLASGIITAALAEYIQAEINGAGTRETSAWENKGTQVENKGSQVETECTGSKTKVEFWKNQIVLVIALLSFSISIFFIKNIYVLLGSLVLSFIFQKMSGRKILLVPHISLWIFAIISSILVPNGMVLFSIFGFSITKGALVIGLQKALRLSAVSALSQCAASLRPKEGTILSLTLSYYRAMSDRFRNTEGNILLKIKATLKLSLV